MEDVLGLSKVISHLRKELIDAQTEGKDKVLNFGVESVEIEMDIALAKSVEGDAKAGVSMEADDMSLLKYVVGNVKGEFSINGHGKYEKVSTQKVKLMLNVKNKDGSDTLLSNSQPS